VGDQLITTAAFIGLGIPGFLLALLVLYFAVVTLGQDVVGLFSQKYIDAPWSLGKVVDLLKHIWVPALIGAITGTAATIRIMRGNLLDTFGQAFVEAARARGLKQSNVIWRHAVRMAITPLVIILGTEALPAIVAGNLLVEKVLNLPTIGPLYINALISQDMYMAGTVLVLIVFLLLVGTLITDLVLAWMDPRIRLE
jgi:peptide/nickel transport system permease protein